jgi:hypothetical protein
MEAILAQLTLATAGLALLFLLMLHFVSPEFSPAWRMVSEYALGRHNAMLRGFFFMWGLSSLLLSALLWGEVSSSWAKVGVAFLVVSAVGEIMGGMFDLKHRLHGVAFGIGVPSLPVAALLLGYHLAGSDGWSAHGTAIVAASHATWVSVVLMGGAMAIMFAGFKRAGIVMGPGVDPPDRVPAGVIAVGGYANRLLVLCDIGWLMLMAWAYLATRQPM